MSSRSAYNHAYYAANKDKQKNKRNLAAYGITTQQRDEMLQAQGGVCAICSASEPQGRGTWHIDHCHTAGHVRGVLCHHCNVGLGHFRDNPEVLSKAIDYLNDPRRAEGAVQRPSQ